eukprot:jgi/Bigna1/133135/aug1.20_g7843
MLYNVLTRVCWLVAFALTFYGSLDSLGRGSGSWKRGAGPSSFSGQRRTDLRYRLAHVDKNGRRIKNLGRFFSNLRTYRRHSERQLLGASSKSDEATFEDLRKWMQEQGCYMSHGLYTQADANGLRGLYTHENLKGNDCILKAPANLTLSPSGLRKEQEIVQLVLEENSNSSTRQVADLHLMLIKLAAEKRKKKGSKWYSYLQTLPSLWDFRDHPLMKTQSPAMQLLAGHANAEWRFDTTEQTFRVVVKPEKEIPCGGQILFNYGQPPKSDLLMLLGYGFVPCGGGKGEVRGDTEGGDVAFDTGFVSIGPEIIEISANYSDPNTQRMFALQRAQVLAESVKVPSSMGGRTVTMRFGQTEPLSVENELRTLESMLVVAEQQLRAISEAEKVTTQACQDDYFFLKIREGEVCVFRWIEEVGKRYVPLLKLLDEYNSLEERLRKNDEDCLSSDDEATPMDVKSSYSVLQNEMNHLKRDLKAKIAVLRSQASAENDAYLEGVILPLIANASIVS